MTATANGRIDQEEGDTPRRRPRDRGFQRPGGPALVARPEPLASASAPPAPTQPAPSAPAPEPEAPPTSPAPAVEEHDAPEPSPSAATPARTAPKQGRGSSLPMPPARHVELRVQFNTKLRPATITRTKAFADHHQASIQDVVELALDEYLTRRGWPVAGDS